ncbi:MAG: nuclear transport factor 2 family protein [Betaproteobacteria bacterium]|nr:nuclear transport factor 2 family protein [Betaproteobacteria bacterium]
MKRFVQLLWLSAVLVIVFPNVAVSGTEQDLNQLEENRYAALIAGDWAALDALLADEFFYNQGGGGSVSKLTFLDYMKAGDAKVRKAAREDTKIRLYGDTAVVTGVAHVDVTLKGEDKTLHSRYLHVWTKTPDGWKLAARQATYLPEKK